MSVMERRFQFLIGRLATDLGDRYGVEVQEFQFLIGRLATISPSSHHTQPQIISIPYR